MNKVNYRGGIDSTFYQGMVIVQPGVNAEIDPDNFEQVRDAIFSSPNGQTVGSPEYTYKDKAPKILSDEAIIIKSMSATAIGVAS